MKLRLAHGSQRNELTELRPQTYFGSNGSQDGVGINLTEDISLARGYAKDAGSVYLSDIDITGFLHITEDNYLTKEQANKITELLSDLPEDLQYRFATDICGKKDFPFENDDEAEAFYRESKSNIKALGLCLDRLNPDIDYDDKDRTVIKIAHKDFSDIQTASTKRIHWCLNMYDNHLATHMLKSISTGLILERDTGKRNFLSFRGVENIVATMDSEFLKKSHANTLIQRSMNNHSEEKKIPTNQLEL
tara:strand:- start:2522 stop:3265 length:744 start_codon:yes stop_codon:yes gene_type:complete